MKKSFLQRIFLFFQFNWLKIIIVTFSIFILISFIWGVHAFITIDSYTRKAGLAQQVIYLPMGALQAVIFAGVYMLFLMGGTNRFKKKSIKGSKVNVKFDDVIGLEEAKIESMEVVSLIKDHKRIQNIGGKIIKGILMIGAPGCGKTLLAKAIATEADIPFLSIVGSEFVEVFVGVGASRVRSLFKKARQYAKAHGACIVFIDELDVIGSSRSFNQWGGGGMETNSTQNQLLSEMDGLRDSRENIIVIGATNADVSKLDAALLRPGRFDRKIHIDKPLVEDREKLFRYYLKKVKYNPAIDSRRLANYTVGKSPADIENIVKEAALIATRDGKDVVEYKNISEALERIDLGLKRKRRIAPKERLNTAYHEAGHAIAAYYLHPLEDVFKLSIVSRSETLGVCHTQPLEEILAKDRDWYLAEIKASLAGYAAEKLKSKTTTNGVSSDFRNATNLAQVMIWRLGMGIEGEVGDYITPLGRTNELEGVLAHLSDSTKERLNKEVEQILRTCYQDVEALLIKESALLDKLANSLLQKDELEYEEIDEICQQYGQTKVRKIEEEGLLKQFRTTFGTSLTPKLDSETKTQGNNNDKTN
jgi:cell division protease FtsH